MEKQHLGLLLRIGTMVALPALAVGYYPSRISAGSQEKPYSSWSDYGGSPDSMGYSSAKQINKTNVTQLKLAWFVPAPGPAGSRSTHS
jgi:glucose dehydrogenase